MTNPTKTSVILPDSDLVSIRREFGPTFQQIAETDDRIVAVTADLGGSVNLSSFGESHPDRYFNSGVSETHKIVISDVLAMQRNIS